MSTEEKGVYGNPNRPYAVTLVTARGLPPGWKRELIGAIREHAGYVPLVLGTHEISREDDLVGRHLASITASGQALYEAVPWLEDFYRDAHHEQCSTLMNRELLPIDNPNEAATGNVFGSGMRMETHVDGWPVNSNVYLQQNPGGGGDLVIALSRGARTYQEVVAGPTISVPPTPGTMNVVTASNRPHAVTVVRDLPDRMFSHQGRGSQHEDYMREHLEKKVFEKSPYLTLDEFWDSARISLNFAYTTRAFNRLIERGRARNGFSERILSGTSDAGLLVPR